MNVRDRKEIIRAVAFRQEPPFDLGDLRSHRPAESDTTDVSYIECNGCPDLRGDSSGGLQRVATRQRNTKRRHREKMVDPQRQITNRTCSGPPSSWEHCLRRDPPHRWR